jgi:ribosomal protein L24
MEDVMKQEIQLGDLVAVQTGSRYATLKPGRVVRICERSVRVAIEGHTWRSNDNYRVTRATDPRNVIVIEREFVQPGIKKRLESWNGSAKKKIHEVIGCGSNDVIQWINSRCSSLEE